MLDQAKSSPNSRPLSADALTSSPSESTGSSKTLTAAISRLIPTDTPLYSIRVADNPGTPCADCAKQDTGHGPVGFRDANPLCDLCLLEGSHELGMVLALISVVRSYANVSGNLVEHRAALEELGVFARIYDKVAAKSGPARVIKIVPDFNRKDDSTDRN